MIYRVCKNTNWGYITEDLDGFEPWYVALKFSLRQGDDLVIMKCLRDRQQAALDELQPKLLHYADVIQHLEKEQNEMNAKHVSIMKNAIQNTLAQQRKETEDQVIANPPPFPPKIGPTKVRVNRRNQIKMLPYPVVLTKDDDGPPLKRALKGQPYKNLRPRRVPLKK
jgi:hypothetical protein